MFDDIIGNDKVKEILSNAIKTNNILHSYLFVGTEGIGKSIIAKKFAKMILCVNKDKETCNNTCEACVKFDNNNNPDFEFIKPDGNNMKIDQIREMNSKVMEKPIISGKKVYIIDDSEKMTKEAQNSLLKTLEEPPQYVVIILICSKENYLLNTIKSRCTKIVFDNLSNEEINNYLRKNNYEILDNNFLNLSQGSIKRALQVISNKELYENLEDLVNNIKTVNKIEFINNNEFLYKEKEKIDEILEYINVLIYNQMKSSIEDRLKYINCINIVEDTKKRLKANSNYDMCIDNLLFGIGEEFNEKHSRSEI